MSYMIAINRNYDGNITFLRSMSVKWLMQALLFIPVFSFGQNQIDLTFNQVELREEFAAQNENWPYLTTMENLYVPDKDEYFMHRRHKTNPYAILTNWKNNLSTFNILTTLKLGPTEDANQTIGVIFLVQPDGKGAVAFEFNKFRQYRVKQLVGAYYKFLSGDNESQGWVKSSQLAAKNEYNEIDIRVNLPQVDVYVNGKFIQSFDVLDYKPGDMGFLIGPDTKAKSDYFYVYTTDEGHVEAELEQKSEETNRSAVEQLSKLRYELEQEKRSLRECQLERQKAVTILEEEMGGLRQSNDRLALQNRALQEFKNQVLVEVDEDVFLTLAENLKAEILKNQKLESQVQVYKDSLNLTHVKYNKLKLALLDKAIKKAEKDKEIRDAKEATETKQEIEKELFDKRLSTEQENWEAAHPNATAGKDTTIKKTTTEPVVESKKPEPKPTTTKSSEDISEEQIEARPLPVKVRTAQKKQD
ncbi:MAG: hypothetical protein K9J17_17075 [Flavobacteriales bacterium]|nr:hypothetical protein [Flavobacteriales bacterium]